MPVGGVVPRLFILGVLGERRIALALIRPSDWETNARLRLQQADDTEQVLGGGIARRSEHAHQALGRSAERGAKFFETDRGVDARAQRGAPLLQIAVEQRLHRLTEQCLPKLDVAASPRPNRLAKTSRQGHDQFLLVRPAALRAL